MQIAVLAALDLVACIGNIDELVGVYPGVKKANLVQFPQILWKTHVVVVKSDGIHRQPPDFCNGTDHSRLFDVIGIGREGNGGKNGNDGNNDDEFEERHASLECDRQHLIWSAHHVIAPIRTTSDPTINSCNANGR